MTWDIVANCDTKKIICISLDSWIKKKTEKKDGSSVDVNDKEWNLVCCLFDVCQIPVFGNIPAQLAGATFQIDGHSQVIQC